MFPGTDDLASRFLAAQPWYACLPWSTQTRLIESLLRRSGKKGAVMLPAGAQVEGWYGVLSGLVKLQSIPVQGKTSSFVCAACGDWFGEGSAMNVELRRYEVVALRDTELLCLPHPEFHQLRATSLEFNQFLAKQLSIRVSQTMALIETSRLRTPEQRVALSLSRLFWGATRKLNLSQDELASLVGISRQTVNQSLKSLTQRGLVTMELGRLEIPDDVALTNFVFDSPKPDRVAAAARG